MAKKKDKCCDWSGKEWTGVVVSEAALYFFFWYGLTVLRANGNLWIVSLILLVLINVMFFTCPVFNKHFF